MRSLIKKYLMESDALTAWLILKAPLPVAVYYFLQVAKGNLQALQVALFFFPLVYLLIINLYLEILQNELLSKLKFESGLETELHKKLFVVTRIGMVVSAVAEIIIFPHILNLAGAPSFSDIPVMLITALLLIFIGACFLWQIRFRVYLGRLLHVLETKRKWDEQKAPGKDYRIRTLNPSAFRKVHERIKEVLEKQ